MATAAEFVPDVDPRVRRTRVMLESALAKLMEEKDFDRISIQEIADEATLSRATFYDHYADKDALLSCVVAGRFRHLIEERGIRFTGCEGAMHSIALGVCAYLAEMRAQKNPSRPLETAVVGVISGMVMEGLTEHPPTSDISAEMAASTIAWAIFGAVKAWVATENRVPAETIATQIERMLTPVFSVVSG